ncbi:hypothetical protein [Sphingomonas sp.]|uniref:hypothetical protein n=1 Tax=Sphingomonas sp. TaxID=28214 RepID=UPI001B0CB41A|nr:hypothetical protein [Sphingomonas sp.]MBO9712653.1 hypothetical protein [Sphingomonas sp.]
MIFLAPLLIQAEAEPARFLPPLAVPFRVVTERDQQGVSGHYRFRVERLVRFARDGLGYRAELRVTAVEGEGSEDVSTMFEASYSGLTGRTLVLRLDAAGKVIAIDDREAVWAAVCDSVGRIFALRTHKSAEERALLARRIAEPLRSLPPERQLRVLGSILDAMIAHEPGEAIGTRQVRVPGDSPFGGKLSLTGTRTVAPIPLGRRISVEASGDAALPAANGSQPPSGHVVLAILRDFDTATGLLTASSETVTSQLDQPGISPTVRIATTRVERLDPAAWPAD